MSWKCPFDVNLSKELKTSIKIHPVRWRWNNKVRGAFACGTLPKGELNRSTIFHLGSIFTHNIFRCTERHLLKSVRLSTFTKSTRAFLETNLEVCGMHSDPASGNVAAAHAQCRRLHLWAQLCFRFSLCLSEFPSTVHIQFREICFSKIAFIVWIPVTL